MALSSDAHMPIGRQLIAEVLISAVRFGEGGGVIK